MASAFDKIVVGPGDYSDEHVRVNCSLEIVGESADSITARDTTALARSHRQSVAGSRIRCIRSLHVHDMPLSHELCA